MHELIDSAAHETAIVRSGGIAPLEDFCRSVGSVVSSTALSDIPRQVAGLLPDLLALPDILSDAQRQAPPDGYGRNCVFICPQDMFSVLAMIWPAGVSTPIHDHRDWCSLGVYQGVIEETYYHPLDDTPDCTRAVPQKMVRHQPGSVAHVPVVGPNIHKIHNPTDEVAISIHVYGGNCETLGPNLDKIYTVQP
jgi:predicted metal-dependent enzyme (double-stranded beta helix superfamily)